MDRTRAPHFEQNLHTTSIATEASGSTSRERAASAEQYRPKTMSSMQKESGSDFQQTPGSVGNLENIPELSNRGDDLASRLLKIDTTDEISRVDPPSEFPLMPKGSEFKRKADKPESDTKRRRISKDCIEVRTDFLHVCSF
jgi:hypothetical protein